MVYYIRFLKTPRIQTQKTGSCIVSTLVCITTDLGDAFLSHTVNLLVTLAIEHTKRIVYQEYVVWHAGRRELSIYLGPFPRQLSKQDIILGISATDARQPYPPSADDMNIRGRFSIPSVISGWSAPFGHSNLVAESLVERRLRLKDELDLRIWEETGNSIARHIWDAALASIIYLRDAIDGQAETMLLLRERLQSQGSLRILELGSGCGIVGIALSQLLSTCSIVLTDLPEVEDIVTRNTAAANPARSSSLEFQALDWDEELSARICNGGNDLIVVSDCTYNADSLPALVSVMTKLVQLSPGALILVAVKRRHDSEAVFFDLMQAAELSKLDQDTIKLPSQHDDEDQIELYTYGRKAKENIST